MIKSRDIGTVYVITNQVNKKKYIGQTWYDINYRFKKHFIERKCIKLARAMQMYGKDNFFIEPIDTAITQKDLDELECFYIKQYDTIKNGYNCKDGGSNGKLSQEIREKISIAHKGKVLSTETKRRISANNKSGTFEVRQKNSQSSLTKTNEKTPSKIIEMLNCGMTQQMVANYLGISQSYVSRIKNGNRRVL